MNILDKKEEMLRPRPNGDFGMHSRDAYPQFADVWVWVGGGGGGGGSNVS